MSSHSQAQGKSHLLITLYCIDFMIVAPKRANRGKNMAALIEEEGLDEDGQQRKQSNTRHDCNKFIYNYISMNRETAVLVSIPFR